MSLMHEAICSKKSLMTSLASPVHVYHNLHSHGKLAICLSSARPDIEAGRRPNSKILGEQGQGNINTSSHILEQTGLIARFLLARLEYGWPQSLEKISADLWVMWKGILNWYERLNKKFHK